MTKAKRGRPISEPTKEKRRLEEMFANPPDHIGEMTEAENRDVQDMLDNMEGVRKEILKTYKHSATTPNQHAYDMASIGDEMLEGYEERILQRDKEYETRARDFQQSGVKETKKAADTKAKEIYKLNKSLIDKIKPLGHHSVTSAAKIILLDWNKRGIHGEKPSERTIRNLIIRGSPHPEHKVGKGSLKEK
jgi:hypothetical protein